MDEVKENVEDLTRTIAALERTVLIKFAEMNGRDIQIRRAAIVLSTFISIIIAAAGVAVAALF